MPQAHYRHTQVGWMMLVVLGVTAIGIGLVLWLARVGGLLVFLELFFLVLAALFATLRVEIDERELRCSFGVGLIRKRTALGDIRQFASVENPWWYGWGIHLTPAGVLYNVSGRSAVQLLLKDGSRLRIGTDEPERLCQALEQRLGPSQPLSDTEEAQVRRAARRTRVVLGVVLGTVAVLIGAMFYFHEQPPEVTLTADSVRVKSVFYSQELALRDVTQLSLEQRLPRIQLRTNGYAAGGTLRGHFRLDELGDGQLFVEYSHPPYILIRRGADFVIVNFADPAETTALYRQLSERWSAVRPR